jgi:hypothetical protein
MRFEQYFQLIKEDPDTVNFLLNGKNVQLTKDSTKAIPFGIINWNAKFEHEEKEFNFFENINSKISIMIGDHTETHEQLFMKLLRLLDNGKVYIIDLHKFQLISLDLSHKSEKEHFLNNTRKYRFPISSHEVLMPCGRIWKGENIDNIQFDFISFWRSDVKITREIIETILENSYIDKSNWDNVYLEFSSDQNNKNRLTFGELKFKLNTIHAQQRRTKQDSELAHVAAGFGGQFKDKKGAGSLAQANKTKKAGFDNTAEYKGIRYPHQESIQ